MGSHKLILDMDTGIDDALALAYLATFSDAELLGVIGTYGNVATDTAVRNTAYVLELLELHDVPVMRGSQAPSWAAAFIGICRVQCPIRPRRTRMGTDRNTGWLIHLKRTFTQYAV